MLIYFLSLIETFLKNMHNANASHKNIKNIAFFLFKKL